MGDHVMHNASTKLRTERATYDYAAASEYIGIKPRTLWNMTSPRGPIAAISIGRRVLFTQESLDAFLASRAVEAASKGVAIHE